MTLKNATYPEKMRAPRLSSERSRKELRKLLSLLLPPFMTWELASEEVPNQTKYRRWVSDPKEGHEADLVRRH